jgi:hypothetical protein
MEHTDWTMQSAVVLIAGLVGTAALFAAAMYVFVKGGK